MHSDGQRLASNWPSPKESSHFGFSKGGLACFEVALVFYIQPRVCWLAYLQGCVPTVDTPCQEVNLACTELRNISHFLSDESTIGFIEESIEEIVTNLTENSSLSYRFDFTGRVVHTHILSNFYHPRSFGFFFSPSFFSFLSFFPLIIGSLLLYMCIYTLKNQKAPPVFKLLCVSCSILEVVTSLFATQGLSVWAVYSPSPSLMYNCRCLPATSHVKITWVTIPLIWRRQSSSSLRRKSTSRFLLRDASFYMVMVAIHQRLLHHHRASCWLMSRLMTVSSFRIGL